MKILEALNSYLSRLISEKKPTATLDSPAAAQVAKAEAASSRLATLNSVTDPAKRVKVLAAAADAVAADTPRTLPNAKAQNEVLAATLAAIKSEMPGADSASDAMDTIPELIAEIIESASVAPNTLEHARGLLGNVRTAARILETKTLSPTAAAVGKTSYPTAAASTQIAALQEMFVEAGLVFPPIGAPGVHKNYLRRQIESKAKSGAFGADVAAAVVHGPVTIRKADIIVPPTDADYYDAYVKLQADQSPTGVEKRQKFFAQYGDIVQRVARQKKQTEMAEARAKSQAERDAAAKVHADRIAADNAKRTELTAQLKAVGHRA